MLPAPQAESLGAAHREVLSGVTDYVSPSPADFFESHRLAWLVP